ncbi:MAG: terminase family protein [Propionibacteriaceae bacterium]|nr:terminase family protein [Propionibacteriaceae bacterium]
MNTLAASLVETLDPVAFARGRGFEPEPWQADLLRSTAGRIAVVCSRQVGKTFTTAYKALWTAIHSPGRDVLIISPSLRQSTEMLVRIKAIWQGMRGTGRLGKNNDSQMELPNKSRILSMPGNETTVRGFANVKLLICDEAARVEDDVWASVLPMVGSDGQVMVLSTPWGQRGFFYALCDESPMNGWEQHRVTVYDSHQWNEQRIAEVKASVGRFVFTSDYLAEFTDTEDAIFSGTDIARAVTDEVAPLFPNGVPTT